MIVQHLSLRQTIIVEIVEKLSIIFSRKSVDNPDLLRYTSVCNRGVAQFGRALRSGRRGRKFESCRLDSKINKA